MIGWLPLTAMPMKFELGSYSPLTYSRAGAVEVPRFTVWLTWLAPVQLFVTVTWFAVAVATICSPSGLVEDPLEYWQACVLFRTWVVGFADRFLRKLVMMAGFNDVSAAIVRRPVPAASVSLGLVAVSLTSLPWT